MTEHTLGKVTLVNAYGDDLVPVNIARASFAKHSETMRPQDKKLLGFLIKEPHWSPFRHCFLQLNIEAPLMVARQWWKYVVGSYHDGDMPVGDILKHEEEPWNEMSRRYVTEDLEFYVPPAEGWRAAPENRKQGSGNVLSTEIGSKHTEAMEALLTLTEKLYQNALDEGVCAEQARLFLPAYALKTKWYWTASIQAVAFFLEQRLDHEAQSEIRWFASEVEKAFALAFPVCYEAWKKYRQPNKDLECKTQPVPESSSLAPTAKFLPRGSSLI